MVWIYKSITAVSALSDMQSRVLVLDDDTGSLEFMEDLFVSEGFDVKIIDSTNDIFCEIREYKPDILLLDYILNGINGGELCHQVKTNQETCSLPVIILSAYSKVIESLGYYGCDKFISKPFDNNHLVDEVNNLIGNLSINRNSDYA